MPNRKWPMVIHEEMGFWKSWIQEPFPIPPEDSAVQKSEKPGKPQGSLLAVHTQSADFKVDSR